jgi:uncharacterized ferritin-like protein (DUF455 family)
MDLRQRALALLQMTDPVAKAAAVREWHGQWPARHPGQQQLMGQGAIDVHATLTDPGNLPGRPVRPVLVQPSQLARRSPFTASGRAALLHAVAHIEFNAINLALDAIWRFSDLPAGYYFDWQRVAAEESLHFTLLRNHLLTLDSDYGEFDAHDGLWTMTQRTAGDVTARMALVPRILEARGLDATPPMRARLLKAGDHAAVAILDIILRDEIGHVAIGNHWYRWLCERDGLEPMAHAQALALRHGAPAPRPPFNLSARAAAGFLPQEIEQLK